ncbi:hypothetical protein HUS23_08725 [Ectothiorhodospiraceae bacterium 2226]|nr:hypothetical protein HUS23_08725 [Ectothiorhodospiraceae bacterium 2226]
MLVWPLVTCCAWAAEHGLDFSGGRTYFEQAYIQPSITRIAFDDGEVVLNDRYRAPAAAFERGVWPVPPPLDDTAPWVRPLYPDPASPPPSCVATRVKVPEALPQPPRALACAQDRWLLFTGGYCPEGENITGRIWFSRAGVLEELNVIPRCHSPNAGLIHGDTLWVGTDEPVEKYGPDTGVLLEMVRVPGEPLQVRHHLSGGAITALALAPDERTLWAVSPVGVHRLDLETRRWRHHYWRYRLGDDGQQIELHMSDAPMSAEDYDLWSPLLALPILDRGAFIAGFHAAPRLREWHIHVNSVALWPHYRDALLAALSRPAEERPRQFMHTHDRLLMLVLDARVVDAQAQISALDRMLLAAANADDRRLIVSRLNADTADRLRAHGSVIDGLDAAGLDGERAFYRALDARDAGVCDMLARDAHVRAVAEGIVRDQGRDARTIERCGAPPEPPPPSPEPRPAALPRIMMGTEVGPPPDGTKPCAHSRTFETTCKE